jgi:hypothetical protein
VLLVAVVEIASFSFLVGYDLIARNQTLPEAFDNRWREIEKVYFEERVSYGVFDPISVTRLMPGSYYGPFPVNAYGYISNSSDPKSDSGLLDLDNEFFTVLIFGGSSVAGTGSKRPEETISAKLEKRLNEEVDASEKIRFRVLNLGAGGGFLGAEFLKLQQYYQYIEPKVVISLDGFNDFWNAEYESERAGIDTPIVNWGDVSYKYFESVNGGFVLKSSPLKFLPFTSYLSIRVWNKLRSRATKNNLYATHPFAGISSVLLEKSPFFADVLGSNLEALGAVACGFENKSDKRFFGYLQPHVYSPGYKLSDNEVLGLERWVAQFADYVGSGEEYQSYSERAWSEYRAEYLRLRKKYKEHKCMNFSVELESIFAGTNETLLVDNIHYKPHGNEVISDVLFDDITKIFGFKLASN